MVMKRTTVMVDDADLRVVKAAAQREGRSEAEYIREAFHLVALRAQRWDNDVALPELSLGGPVSQEQIDAAMREGTTHS